MKTNEMRKLVSQKYKDGELVEIGNNPAQPSRAIYNLRKAQLEAIIKNGSIDWDILGEIYQGKPQGKPNGESKGEPNGESKGKPNGESKGESKGESGVNPKVQIPVGDNLGKPWSDREYVTTEGIIKATEVVKDLGISEMANVIKGISKIASEALQIAQDKDAKPIIKQFKIGGADPVILDGEHLHPAFDKVLFHTKCDQNVYIYGKAGTGKTTMAKQISKVLGVDFATYSCSSGMSESMLTGKCLFDGTYFSTKFVELVKNGGLILLDEFDAIDGNLGVYMNSFLANGILPTPNNRDEQEVIRHKDCYIICAGNTSGNGNGSRMYSGRNRLDGATLDRFTTIEFGYDAKLEKKLVGGHNSLYNALNELRCKVDEFELERVISTRLYSKLGFWMANGKDLKYCLSTITECWLDSERDKVEVKKIISANS